ncbi:class I SAM-dependent methyltransferase [Rhodoligotrophos defluvii]|jgi:ubiquinone/menaquinone biosynthesis C-methylase UbiE|uniref:class I SAM-dependent methyltransferase n=1 Tax=Rhodoligotrophos defluvii TaxID=2561934 RepID=UPI0010C9F8C8|nr:methyltransferase domain-containing protein [Rhodoligotrophos defluvii]
MGRNDSSNPAEVYEHYLGPAIADPWTRVLLKYASPRRGESVLDLACGTGSVARQVAPMVGVAGRIVAIDISAAMLAVARALPAPAGAPIEWCEGDARRLELPDGIIDLALCQQGVQFFSDRAAAVAEMRRVLTDGGRAIISVWQALERHPVFEALFDATARHLGVPISAVDLSFSLGDAEELRALLGTTNFSKVEITPRSLEIHLPSPDRFVQLTVLGAATSIPAFTRLDETERFALVQAVAHEIASVVSQYGEGDELIFPMSTHIAVCASD